ncbi:hypothetical protein TRFO_28526 [Tritrichomonas foetus]|uniref:Uncharacterized protein n=1 Tax=Tritrichomonas foetus TaxID=1144522 RepID=A0A1J4JZW9_9EUKA|nr:hypothetical protein TRFO_28526 [Tritrichomonas foetus]|eukprot:OHT04032.1 hypothetical protein TRFO_28526 [Tritrichomonas foetus]
MLFLFAFLAFSNIKYVKESLAEEEAPSTAEQIFTTFYKENDETDPPTTYQPQGGGNEETEPQTTYQPQSGGNEDPDPPTTYDQGGDVSPPTESDVLDIEYFVTILPQILGDGISYSEFYKLFPDLAETLADHKLMKGIFDFISKEDFTLNEFYNKTMENLGIKEYDGILENSTELLEKLFKYSDPSTKLADLFKLKDKELLDSLDKVNEVYKLLGEKVFEFLNIQNKETWEKRFTDFVSNYQKATLKEVVQHLNLKPELLDAIHNVFGFMYDKKDFKDFIDPVRKQIKYDDFKKSVLTLNDFEKKPLSMINLLKVLTSAVGFTNDALQYLIDQFHGLLTETFDDVVFSFLDIFERAIGTRAQTLVDILKIIQTIKPDENDPKKEYLVAIREFVNRMGSPFCQDQKCDGIEQLIETVTLFTKPVNVTEVLTSQKQFPVETIMTIVETVQAISSPDLNWGNLFVQLRHLPNVNLGPINSTTLIDCVITAISFVGWEVPEEGKAHVLASVDLIQIAKDLDVYNYLEMVFEFVREFKESPMREFSYLSEYSDLLETIEKLISKISKAVAQTSETPIMELLGSYNETVLTACKFLQHLDEPIISLIQKALKELGFPDTEKLKNIKEIVQELIKLCKEFQELFNYLISLIPYSDLMMSQYEAIMNKFWGLWVDLEKTTLASIADQMYNGVGAVLENLASASEVISKEGAKVIEI